MVPPGRSSRVFSAKTNGVVTTRVAARARYIAVGAGLYQRSPARPSCCRTALGQHWDFSDLILCFSWRKRPNNSKTDLWRVINALPFMAKCNFFIPLTNSFQKTPVLRAEPLQHYIRPYKTGNNLYIFCNRLFFFSSLKQRNTEAITNSSKLLSVLKNKKSV